MVFPISSEGYTVHLVEIKSQHNLRYASKIYLECSIISIMDVRCDPNKIYLILHIKFVDKSNTCRKKWYFFLQENIQYYPFIFQILVSHYNVTGSKSRNPYFFTICENFHSYSKEHGWLERGFLLGAFMSHNFLQCDMSKCVYVKHNPCTGLFENFGFSHMLLSCSRSLSLWLHWHCLLINPSQTLHIMASSFILCSNILLSGAKVAFWSFGCKWCSQVKFFVSVSYFI